MEHDASASYDNSWTGEWNFSVPKPCDQATSARHLKDIDGASVDFDIRTREPNVLDNTEPRARSRIRFTVDAAAAAGGLAVEVVLVDRILVGVVVPVLCCRSWAASWREEAP
jgi:hypothetical protein